MKDMDPFLELIEEYHDQFYRYVYRMAWDTGKADDIFAEAVLAAYQNREKFQLGTNFRAWMFRILTNKCFVANRETARAFDSLDEKDIEVPARGGNEVYEAAIEDPDAFLRACGDEVYIAIRALSSAQRACLLMRVVEGFSYQEIANVLEMPLGTVMTHLARGRARLRRELAAYATAEGIVNEPIRLIAPDDENKDIADHGS